MDIIGLLLRHRTLEADAVGSEETKKLEACTDALEALGKRYNIPNNEWVELSEAFVESYCDASRNGFREGFSTAVRAINAAMEPM